MEKKRGWEQETLINELTQGMELTKQLKNYIDPLASPESRDFLIQKIISSYDKALSMLNFGDLVGELHQVAGIVVPPQSSQRSEVSDRDFKDQFHQDVYKKRKTLPRWSEQVRICSETGLGTLDDGYSWRKYGQKDILGANFPRAYYRCTHRDAQGCLATKQVQKTDADPSIVEISYRGRHTCIQSSRAIPAMASMGKKSPKPNKVHHQPSLQEESPRKSEEIIFDYGTVKTEDSGIVSEILSSFSFLSTPIESGNIESITFPESLKENNFLGIDSPAFLSPETLESEFFTVLACPIDNFGLGKDVQHKETDVTEILLAPPSVANSPIGNLDFSLDEDFDQNFALDTSEFFC